MISFLRVTEEATDTLVPHPQNPRHGSLDLIVESLKIHGQYRPIVVNERNGLIVAGHHLVMAAKQLNWPTVAVSWVNVDDDQHLRMMLADNRTSDKGAYEVDLLHELLAQLTDSESGLEGTGYTADALATMIADAQAAIEEPAYNAKTVTPRTTPIDMIMCTSINSIGTVVFTMGWKPGLNTSHAADARLFKERTGRQVVFLDNEWHDYDHDVHVKAVEEIRPKYATVRDLVTKEQAERWGVQYYSLQETLDMAADIAEHVPNVILIPKYDCIDDLPETVGQAKVILGYSVLSSYGATPIAVDRFIGRPVHLLGGSWKRQRALLNYLKDDVVSLDNNHLMRVAEHGQFVTPDGETRSFSELFPEIGGNRLMSVFYQCVVLSAGNILFDVAVHYQGLTLATTDDLGLLSDPREEENGD